MSRSRDRKCCYTRWSEPILRRRYSTHPIIPTSDEEASSSGKRSGSSSTFLNKLQLTTPRLETERSGCCGCQNRCFRRRKINCQKKNSRGDDSKSCDNRETSERVHDSLEIELVGDQVEESVAGEKLTALINQLEIATDILEAIVLHVNSVLISNSSLQRVIRLANDFLPKRGSSSLVTVNNYNGLVPADLTTRICQAESCEENRVRSLRDVVDSCSKNLTLSKRLNFLIEEHKVKKEDFNVAAKNFKKLLDGSRLSVSQLDKLKKQYRAIMDDYKENRRLLETELPKIVKTRLTTILRGFETMAEFYYDNDNSRKISDIMKIFGDILSGDNGAIDKRKCEKSQGQSDICQKCRVNKVEKK